MVVRGIANILWSNSITGAAGAGLALGGTEEGDDCELSGVFNQVGPPPHPPAVLCCFG